MGGVKRWVDEAVETTKNNVSDAAKWTGDRLGVSPEAVGGLILGGPFGAAAVMGLQAVGDAMKPPDYSGEIALQERLLDNEKRRRARDANIKEVQGSQLARIYLSQDDDALMGTPFGGR